MIHRSCQRIQFFRNRAYSFRETRLILIHFVVFRTMVLIALASGFPGQVRLAYLAPSSYMRKLDGIVSELQNSAVPKEALNYYVEYGGFENVFRSPLLRHLTHSDARCRKLAMLWLHLETVMLLRKVYFRL